MCEDIVDLLSTFTRVYSSEPLEPEKLFEIFKSVWKKQGWDIVHLKVLNPQGRSAYLKTVLRLFLERMGSSEHLLPSWSEGNLESVGSITLTIDMYQQMLSFPQIFQGPLRLCVIYVISQLFSKQVFHVIPDSSLGPQNPRYLPHSVPILRLEYLETADTRLPLPGSSSGGMAAPWTADYIDKRDQLRALLPTEAVQEAEAVTVERIREAERHISDKDITLDTRQGPTHVAYLLHSTTTVPTRAYESYDLCYHLTVENNKSGDNFIQVHKPPPSESAPPVAHNADMRVKRDMIERLVNQYFKDLTPIYTVIMREEFLVSSPIAPLLLYSICSVAAASRDISQSVFENLRSAVSMVIKAEDAQHNFDGECPSPLNPRHYVPKALSAFWLRSGTAIRMAQDLGLHRAESVKQNLETRRWLWSALTYGHPFMIDVEDCDVQLNSSDHIEDMYMNELLKLSILLGRVLKMIYSPSGLVLATDKGLEALLANIDDWNTNLPPPLRFTVERWSGLVALTRESIDWLVANERVYDVWVMYHTWARRKDPEAAAALRKLRDCIKRWEATVPSEHRSTCEELAYQLVKDGTMKRTVVDPHPCLIPAESNAAYTTSYGSSPNFTVSTSDIAKVRYAVGAVIMVLIAIAVCISLEES
ncbi:hypothetical protein M422DRAFT_65811 [Sphaerobolus stellatus SS14]|nr:hypothetical protein M422DRAFT_65811 [Sphaerobolus stellatus SS14]